MRELLVAGVDGCPGGWVVVRHSPDRRAQDVLVAPTFDDVLAACTDAAVVGVDMPIGLLETAAPGGRPCDRAARAALPGRASCVFSPPVRAVLGLERYADALAAQRGGDPARPGFSLQAFHLRAKLAEVDNALRGGDHAGRVYEVHPELAFVTLHGGPLGTKKSRTGAAQRVALLRDNGFADPEALVRACRGEGARRDDVLDACAAAWSAGRIATGRAAALPAGEPERDRFGLAMQIYY